MGGAGAPTAMNVLARARALPAFGRAVDHWQIAKARNVLLPFSVVSEVVLHLG